ncbi:MAG: type IV secretion system protein [Candidatus Terrybacteria bacterium]|nr:type IV secretion system protein [Candidatus Terrybacteria bacterium]
MKKFSYILISVVILAAVFGPLGAGQAQARSLLFMSFKEIVAEVGYTILTGVSKVMSLAGYFSDTAIEYSVENFGKHSQELVKTGWGISRDIANLFFIFILLYIAIATILQLSGYGMKELLAKVIIIALLVNFSLMITRVVIDSSNILAMEFYNKLRNPIVVDEKGGEIKGAKKPSFSEALVAGINPQTLFNIKETEEPGTETFKQGETDATLMQIFIITSMGSIMFLIIAFVMFAAGVLFVIRSVVLWILMILAPLAFLFMILPATKQYASQWWKKLFDQSFFAPVYLFLFYLVVKIISEGTLIKQLKTNNQTFSSTFGSPDNANIQLILSFALLIVLTVACLIVAKQMGAVGAGAMQSWGQKMKGKAQGYAGKLSGRIARRAVAPAAEAFATGEGKGRITRAFARMGEGARAIPLVGGMLTRGAAKIGAGTRERIGEIQKKYEKYTPKELKNMIPTVMPFNRAAIIQELAKRGELKTEQGLDENELKRSRKIMQRYGMDTRAMDRLRPDIIDATTPEGEKQRADALKKANWVDMDKKTVENVMADKDMRNVVIANAGSGVARKIYEETELGTQEKFFKSLTDLDKAAKGFEDIAKALEKLGNHSMASWARGPIGSKIIDSHLGVEPLKKEEGPFESLEPGTKTFK